MRDKEFETMVRNLHGDRYRFEQDQEGYYVREVVKRMYEVWCTCKGWL